MVPPEIKEIFLQAINEFNNGNYFECHETLEKLWLQAKPENKKFYQGLLHVSVGLYHLSKQNLKGTRGQLNKALSKLAPFDDFYLGVDLKVLRADVQQILNQLEDLHSNPTKIFSLSELTKITVDTNSIFSN